MISVLSLGNIDRYEYITGEKKYSYLFKVE